LAPAGLSCHYARRHEEPLRSPLRLGLRHRKDIEFYRDRLAGCAGPILEPAVGTGRFLIPLLEAGFAIEGFDVSDEMLERCPANCRARGLAPPLHKMRFQDFHYDRRFAAIVVPLSTFELVTDFDEALAALRRFLAQLEPGGRLLLDLESQRGFFDDAGVRSWTTADGDVLTLTDEHTDVDYLAQCAASTMRYEHWRDRHLVDSELELFTLRWWGVREFELALQACGFRDIIMTGSYRPGHAPAREDEVITFEARRGD
jgi:SAM-dependent methyltransferase